MFASFTAFIYFVYWDIYGHSMTKDWKKNSLGFRRFLYGEIVADGRPDTINLEDRLRAYPSGAKCFDDGGRENTESSRSGSPIRGRDRIAYRSAEYEAFMEDYL
jgi:hypothetical protein